MHILRLPAAALTSIGRHGTLVVAASVFVGLAVPELSAVCKPLLGPAIVVMLVLAFMRVDPAELARHWTRPGLIAASAVWIMLAVPALLGLVFLACGLRERMPGLYFMLVLQMAAPGIMSAPALAALMGLDVALTLASLILCTALTPLTASLFSHVYLGTALASPFAFGLRAFLIIAGSAAAAAIVRRLAGRKRLEAHRTAMDGLSVIVMFAFAVAAMDGVTANFMRDPVLVIALTLLSFALALGVIAVTALVFVRAGRARAFAIAVIAGNRNIGLMLAATGFHVPDVAWLYFALAQFPIYLLPHLLKPLAKRLGKAPG